MSHELIIRSWSAMVGELALLEGKTEELVLRPLKEETYRLVYYRNRHRTIKNGNAVREFQASGHLGDSVD